MALVLGSRVAAMRDGIDGRAFKAELRTLDAGERRRSRREFGAWVGAAARSDRPRSQVALTVSGIAVAAILVRLLILTHSRALLAVGVATMAIGQCLAWSSNRRSRRWREMHPFEEWRRRLSR